MDADMVPGFVRPMTLGPELLLLAVDQRRNRLHNADDVDFGLSGTVLVELALANRILIEPKQLSVLNAQPTGDAIVDPVLAAIAAAPQVRNTRYWIGRSPRRQLRSGYLALLESEAAVRTRRVPVLRVFHATEVVLLDPLRYADLRTRFDRIVSDAEPPSPRDRALAGLARASMLTGPLYRGRENRETAKRLSRLASIHPARTELDAAIDFVVAAVYRAVQDRHSSG